MTVSAWTGQRHLELTHATQNSRNTETAPAVAPFHLCSYNYNLPPLGRLIRPKGINHHYTENSALSERQAPQNQQRSPETRLNLPVCPFSSGARELSHCNHGWSTMHGCSSKSSYILRKDFLSWWSNTMKLVRSTSFPEITGVGGDAR